MIEVILAIVISAIIAVVTISYLTQLIATNQLSSEQVRVVDEANVALEFLASEVRLVDEQTWPILCGSPPVVCVVNTPYTALTFTKRLEIPVDPLRQDSNKYNIQYAFNAVNSSLERTSAGITTTVATGVNSFEVREVSNNLFRFQLTLTGADGATFTAETAVRIRKTVPQLDIAFVVNNPANLHASREVPLNNHLQNVLGHTVTLFDDDNQGWTPTNFDLLVLSGQGGINDDLWLANQAVPILTVDAQNYNEFQLGTSQSRNGGGATGTIFAAHFITEIFPIGPPPITLDTGGQRGRIQGFTNDVTMLVHYGTNTARAKILVVEAGGLLVDGVTNAPAKRAFFGAREFGFLNNDGISLFNRTIAWLVQ